MLVVDIGSGDKPLWRADVYVDDLSLGDVQRASHSKTIRNIGKFVNASVTKLPFKDKIFDFSFCSHLLEHIDSPDIAIKEIIRVSRSGYIEIPNGIIETIQPFISHIWFVYNNNNKLIFIRKSKKMHELLLTNGKKYIPLINTASDPFIRLYWKNKIDYEIIGNLKENEKYSAPIKMRKKNTNSINYYIIFVKLLRILFYSKKDTSRVFINTKLVNDEN
jgi:ubiquinone/menaquinone biosynthesis C-methylase UbiE